MSQRTPTKLELHRARWLFLGKMSPLLSFSSLDVSDREALSREVRRAAFSGSDPHVQYARVLSDWGVACPHPQHRRLYSGRSRSFQPLRDHRWYECQACGCGCINEDYDPRALMTASR